MLLELEKIKKDIGILFKNVKCLIAKSNETSPLVATEWSSRHTNNTGHSYTAGTYVFYQGHIYKALYNNQSVLPTNTTYWLDLGEGYLLAEEQADWNSTGGRNFILNKPTKTSNFINNGEDGSSPYMTQSQIENLISQLPVPETTSLKLFVQTANSDTIYNTTVERTLIGSGLGSLEISANTFKKGDAFKASLKGVLSSQNGETLQIRVKTESGVLLMDKAVITLPSCTDKFWNLDLDFIIRNTGPSKEAVIASGGVFSFIKNSSSSYEGICFNFINETTFDTTVSNTLEITAQWGSTNPNNKIFSRLFILSRV